MNCDDLKRILANLAEQYHIKRVELFGSRASGTNRSDSDVDLIIEFYTPVSLLSISELRCELEDELKLDVDIVHGPIRKTDLLEIGKTVEIYAA